MSGRLRLAWLWLPVAAYMAAIFYYSSQSQLPGAVGGIPDTVLHAAGYAGLAVVTVRAVAGGRWAGVTFGSLVLSWAIATGYGATDEFHQRFTPGRSPELRDLRNDALGAAAALGLVGAWGTMKRSARV